MTALIRRAFSRLRAKLRDPNPILVKELRATFRAKLFIRFFYLSILALSFLVLTGSAMVSSGGIAPARVGAVVFQIFFTFVLGIVIVVGTAHAATTLSGEREARTLDTLLLSGMDPRRIVRGKFLASYAMLTLVLVGLAPVVGIAFLFGGVSPLHVLWGYFGLSLWLAVSVSFGVAISSRASKTRVAILLSAVIFGPVALTLVGIQTALAEAASRPWALQMEGPFWFVEALNERFFELDTFALVFLLPLFAAAMASSFFLATAVAALRPVTDDRSTVFKVWSLVGFLSVIVIFPPIASLLDGRDIDEAVFAAALLSAFPSAFFALLFMDEPSLPPPDRGGKRFRGLRRAVGPGAAPTLRFGLLFLGGATAVGAMVLIACNHLFGKPTPELDADAAVLVALFGNFAVVAAFLGAGTYVRTLLQNGLAARVATVAIFGVAVIAPALLSTILDRDAWDDLDEHIPLLMALSPLLPTFLGIGIFDHGVELRLLELFFVTPYALVALGSWIAVERRVRKLEARAQAMRRARDQRIADRVATQQESRTSVELVVRESSPPGEIVVRASKPPGGSE